MHVHDAAQDEVSRRLLEEGLWEPFETSLFVRLVGPGDRVWDVGANLGYYTLLAAHLAGPEGRVEAFEPDPGNLERLAANVAGLDAAAPVELHAAACSDREGDAWLHRAPLNQGDHRLGPGHGARQRVAVRTLRLDAVPGPAPDVVKIDAQGSEPAILRGLGGVLERRPAGLRILVEFWPHGLAWAGEGVGAFLEALRPWALRSFAIFPRDDRLHPVEPDELEEWGRSLLAPETRRYLVLLLLPAGPEGDALAARLPGPAGYDCPLEEPLEFRAGGAGLALRVPAGWSFPEAWGCWTDGEHAQLRLRPQGAAASGAGRDPALRAEFECRALADARRPLHVEARVGGRPVAERRFRHEEWSRWEIPLAGPTRDGRIDLSLRVRDPRTPRAFAGLPDDRRLGLGLRSLTLHA